ncbi:hypothetical protein [Leptospira kanakyensis]|uniref:hypothetical protein n=1 Tax=Leptospira kanakyensis TaxID=2484968 RepID=UPI00223CFEAE|nr:hypothetical protein [Leptospira kanakyensis]MCW7470466.1 hypothetical protein [Leptospira kanakyensis]
MDREQMETFREDLAKTFFLSILKDLSEIGEPLSDYEVKVLIQKALSNSSDLQVEWGDMDRFGNSTLLVKYESNLLLIEASPLISTIRILWNEYQSKEI